MKRPRSLVQQVFTGLWTRRHYEVPLFFNYEDLVVAWDRLRSTQKTSNAQRTLPEDPPLVEVFNLWDVVTSMDRHQNTASANRGIPLGKKTAMNHQSKPKVPSESTALASTLRDIIFVPNSDSVLYKDAISRRGNGKARLRPMRESVYRPL